MNINICRLLSLILLSILTSQAWAAGGGGGGHAVKHAPGDANKGKLLTASCASCHGVDGNSAVPTFPKLAGQGEKYLVDQLKAIKDGKTRNIVEMTGMLNAYSDKDLKDIAAYYASQPIQLSGAKTMDVQVNSGEKVDALKLGENTYRAGNMETKTPACTGCHAPDGLGNAPAGYPRLSGQHADYIEKQLRDYRAGNRTTDGDAQIMRKVAEHLTDAEIISLANYIAGLH